MANELLKPEVIVATTLGLLEREIVLPRLVHRVAEANFRGAKNDTVTLRVPAVLEGEDYEWRTRNAPVTVEDLVETNVDVKLDKHPVSAVAITDEELSLDIRDFATQVLDPQVKAIARRMEGYIVSALASAPLTEAQQITMTSSDEPYDVAVDARAVLNRNMVPASNRYLIVGSDVEAVFLKSDKLSKVDESGTSDALREAIIRRVAGFTVVSSLAIPSNVAYAIHSTAIAFANMAPNVPDGAVAGASRAYNGLALRWIRDYDAQYLRDRSVVSAFAGATSVNDGPEFDHDGDEGASTDEIKSNARMVKITLDSGGGQD